MEEEKVDLALSLGLSSPSLHFHQSTPRSNAVEEARPRLKAADVYWTAVAAGKATDEEEEGASSPDSTLSSVLLERTGSRGISDDEVGDAACRKKLRLSKDQSGVLEDCFKEHNTLNLKQKLALAKQLRLRPRQVEVWFQNRRARTKLKQTEVDCEYLKRWCERLTEENRRLQKEVVELRALKIAPAPALQLLPPADVAPPATLTMCPSCRTVNAAATAVRTKTRTSSLAAVPTHYPFFPAVAAGRPDHLVWAAPARAAAFHSQLQRQ